MIPELPRHGLATLLEMYCDFTADKRYQQADWRIRFVLFVPLQESVVTDRLRPLPKEMLAYARSDTHFLLFIYDNLRNALLDRAPSRLQSHAMETPRPQANIGSSGFDPEDSLLREVLSRSEETSLRLHQTESYDEEEGSGPRGWDTIARKWNKVPLTKAAHRSTPKSIYLRIHDWRDMVAREEDESYAYVFHGGVSSISFTHVGCRYVLPQHYLFQLAEQPPNDLPGLLNIFRAVPPVIKKRASELLDEIRAGGSRSVDISGAGRTVADLAEKSDIKPLRNVGLDEVHDRSGIVSMDLVCSRRTHRDCLVPSDQLVVPSHSLFGVRQTSYKAANSLLLGAGFSSVGRNH